MQLVWSRVILLEAWKRQVDNASYLQSICFMKSTVSNTKMTMSQEFSANREDEVYRIIIQSERCRVL